MISQLNHGHFRYSLVILQIYNILCNSTFVGLEQSITQYCSSHEDLLEWLLDVEDRLNSMEAVSKNLDEIKIQFQVHSDYMQYLDSNQEEIGKVNKTYICFTSNIILLSNFYPLPNLPY